MDDAPAEFPAVYAQHVRGVRRWIAKRINNEQTVEDLVQETFMRVYSVMTSWERIENMGALVQQIAKYVVWGHWNHDRWKNRRQGNQAVEYEDQLMAPPVCSYGRMDPERVLIHREGALDHCRRLRRATRLQRKIYWMRTFRGQLCNEIADELGKSTACVQNALARVRYLIRRPAWQPLRR